MQAEAWDACLQMLDVTLSHVMADFSYHPLYERLMSVLQHAKKCAHACGDVRSYIPYGVPDHEPDTSDSIKIKCRLMETSLDTGDAPESPVLSVLRTGVTILESLEEEQNAYLAEFAKIQRARQTWGQNTGTRVEMNCFDVLEPPSLWFREHTAVVCLWRSIQHNAFMHSCRMSWVSSKRKWSWTDVKDEDVLQFFSSLPTVALHTCAQRHYALGMSIEAWETTRRTFGVSQIWNGDVWSGIHQVRGLEAGEVHP